MSENTGQAGSADRAQHAAFTQSIQETQEAGQNHARALEANKMDASQDTLKDLMEDHSALRIAIKSEKRLEKATDKKVEKAKETKESVLVRKDDSDGLAGDFSQRQGNREYHLDPVILSILAAEELGQGITPDTNTEEVITLIQRRMVVDGQSPDVSIVDKAFEFLLEVTDTHIKKANEGDKPRLTGIYNKLEEAKHQHFTSHAVEIQVAQKIIGAVDAVVQTTGQSVKETLERYRDVVHNPPDFQTLRKYYDEKGYESMVLELKGLRTYVGGNLKRPNIENPELARLIRTARLMQGLEGVFEKEKEKYRTLAHFLESHHIIDQPAQAA